MRIQVSKTELANAVNKVKSVVKEKSALPILSHLLLETGDSCVYVTGTDLKTTLIAKVDCTVERPGTLAVNGQRLASLLGEDEEGDAIFDLEEDGVVLFAWGNTETRLFSMPADDFPPVKKVEAGVALSFSQAVLRRLFQKTAFAICTEQGRYNLTGLLFELRGGKLTVVATDGRRMSLAAADDPVDTDQEIKVIIPAKMVTELTSLFSSDPEAMVDVRVESSHVAFSMEGMTAISALIEGSFPNYEMVIPKKHDKEVVVGTEAFARVMRLGFKMTNDKFRNVRLCMRPDVMQVVAKTPEVGEYTEEIPVEYSGEEVEIAFNPIYVLDVLRNVEQEKVCLLLKDTASPGVIKPYTDAPVDNYVNVVMPIRI